jgi:hemolysin activation/secretion protein
MQTVGGFSARDGVRNLPALCVLLALSCVASLCHAQQAPTVPSAGDVLRDLQDRPQAPSAPAAAPIEIAPEKRRAIKSVPGLQVDVKGFRFSGQAAVREEDLQAQVKGFTGPGKTFDDLQAAVDAVSEYLQRQGYIVAQAFLPEQPIRDGIIEIGILEGRLGQIRVDIEPDVPVSRSIIEGLLSRLTPGTVLHRDTLERALFLVSDLRGLAVRSIVEPGATPGTSDLVLKITAGRRFDGLAEIDNYTSRFTGDARLGAGVNVNSPLRRGDLLSFRGLLGLPGGGADLDFGRISYLSPIGNYGTKLGLAYLRLNYSLGTTLFDQLRQSGRSEVTSVFGLHPIVRTRNFNVFGQANYDFRKFSDTQASVGTTSDRKTQVGTVALVGDSRDALLRGGINNFSAAFTSGDLDIETFRDRTADQSGFGHGTNGRYQRFNGSLSRLNALTPSTVLFVSYAFQLASKNLDASEKIGLGGPTAVRAYAVGEATSDEAHLVTAEVRYALPVPSFMAGNLAATGFFDYAHGRLNKDPLPPEVSTNMRTLSGAGIGLTWARQDDFLVRASFAWRLTGHPLSDPQDRKPRIFFQLQKFL